MLTSLTLIVGMSIFFPAAEIGAETFSKNSVYDIILRQAVEQDSKLSSSSADTFEVVQNTLPTSGVAARTHSTQVSLQRHEVLDTGIIAQTTILPYKIAENGELMDSFSYYEGIANQIQPRDIHTKPLNLVDVTITITTYFAKYNSYVNMVPFYRHSGVEAYWSSSNSAVSMLNLIVRYESRGDLYSYPACIDNPMNDYLLQKDFIIQSAISRAYPSKGTTYMDGNHTMDYNTVINCSDIMAPHGGLVSAEATYSLNGTTRNRFDNYYVYTR